MGSDDLRRHYQDLQTHELLHLYRAGGFTDSALEALKEVLDSREPGWEPSRGVVPGTYSVGHRRMECIPTRITFQGPRFSKAYTSMGLSRRN
jgi:hypothetical protein